MWGQSLGKCVVCGQETSRVVFRAVLVPTYICSMECLQKYFQPLGGVNAQQKITETESWFD